MEEIKAYLEVMGIPKRLKGFDYLSLIIHFSKNNPYCSLKDACRFAAKSSGTTEKAVNSSVIYALSYIENKKVRPKEFVKQAVFTLSKEA